MGPSWLNFSSQSIACRRQKPKMSNFSTLACLSDCCCTRPVLGTHDNIIEYYMNASDIYLVSLPVISFHILYLPNAGRKKCSIVTHGMGGLLGWFFVNQYPDVVDNFVSIASPHPYSFLQELSLKRVSNARYVRHAQKRSNTWFLLSSAVGTIFVNYPTFPSEKKWNKI